MKVMSKRELKSLLFRFLPHVHGKKQTTALLTIVLLLGVSHGVLLLGVSHGTFDSLHVHLEPVPIVATVAANLSASGGSNVASFRIDQVS